MHYNDTDLMLYIYNELAPSRRAELTQHLTVCTTCTQKIAALQSTITTVRNNTPAVQPSPVLEAQILAQAAAILTRPTPLWKKLFTLPRTNGLRFALGSGIAVLLFVATSFLQQSQDTTRTTEALLWDEMFLTELTNLTNATETEPNDLLLNQFDTDLNQLTIALASY